MMAKGLWLKEYNQSKLYLWVMLTLFIIMLPVRAMIHLDQWAEMTKQGIQFDDYLLVTLFGASFPSLLIIFLLIVMAAVMIGAERNSRRNDFTFALPYRRSDIFLVKWLIGVLPITIFFAVNFGIAYLMVTTSEYIVHFPDFKFGLYFIYPLIGYVTTYTFALFIGTFCGEMTSQIILTYIFIFFPLGFTFLLGSFLWINFGASLPNVSFVADLTWPIYIFVDNFWFFDTHILTPIIATIIFVVLGQWLYTKNHLEHNGEFLIFKQLQPLFLVGIVTCFALLGGIIVSEVTYTINKVMFYWLGFVTFGGMSFVFTRRLLRMNVMMKNK